MTSNGEYLFIKGHNQYGVLISIVNSNGEVVIIKGHQQDRVAIIIRNHTTAAISNKVDTIFSCD